MMASDPYERVEIAERAGIETVRSFRKKLWGGPERENVSIHLLKIDSRSDVSYQWTFILFGMVSQLLHPELKVFYLLFKTGD